jgi:hypothetical protein
MLTNEQERQLVQRALEVMEPPRRAARNAYVLLWALVVTTVTAVFIVYLSTVPPRDVLPAMVVGGVGSVIILIFWAYAHGADAELVKVWNQWRAEVVREISSDATYEAQEFITAGEFDQTGLNVAGYNEYAGGDLLKVGFIKCSRLAVNRIETRYRTVTYTDANGQSQTKQESYQVTVPVFHGLVLGVPVKLPHPGRVVISDIGFPREWQLKPVRVAHTQINSTYRIGSYPTEFEGHRILTPRLMCALWDFRLGLRATPRVSYSQESRISGGQMWLAAPGLYLKLGSRPGVFRKINENQLRDSIHQCADSVAWVKRAATSLQPS